MRSAQKKKNGKVKTPQNHRILEPEKVLGDLVSILLFIIEETET